MAEISAMIKYAKGLFLLQAARGPEPERVALGT